MPLWPFPGKSSLVLKITAAERVFPEISINTGTETNALGFCQMRQVLDKCARFLRKAQDFRQKHRVLEKSTGFMTDIRGAEAKICGAETKFLARDENMRCFSKVCDAETKLRGAEKKMMPRKEKFEIRRQLK